MTWAGQMGQSRTGQDKSPKAGRPAQGWTSGSSALRVEKLPNKGVSATVGPLAFLFDADSLQLHLLIKSRISLKLLSIFE